LGGCTTSPQGASAPDVAARLPALRDRLSEIRGERLERLPQIERWTQREFRRYLLQRWEREWPLAVAEREERILVALELWPSDLDYREETLRVSLEETNAAYLEDRDTIAVIASGSVSDRTLIHELTHALQEQLWGPLPSPRTFEGQFRQLAWLEGEAIRSERAIPGSSLDLRDWRLGRLPRARPPAHYWFGEDPARLGGLEARPGPGGAGKSPAWSGETPRPLGPVAADEQIVGRRGAMWWAAQVLDEWPGRACGTSYEERTSWWVDDRLRLEEERLVWRIRCDGWAGALAHEVKQARPGFTVRQVGPVVEVSIPLPGAGWVPRPR